MNNFVKVDQVSLGDIVLSQFFDLIQTGVYKAGDRLPCERDLCAALNVSRPVLREVLSVLRHLGYIETVQGGGTYVSNQPLSPAVNSIRFNLATEQVKAFEVWEVRNVLEVEIAGYAAERAGDIEMNGIKEAFERYESLVLEHADQKLINQASCQFHNSIALAAHNDTLSYLLDSVASMLSESREKTGRVKGSNERSLKEHRAIYEAIQKRNKKEARDVMRKHMGSVKSDLVEYLDIIKNKA